MFSDVFGWSPKSIPDIPVSYYSRDYWDVTVRNRIPEVDKDYYLARPIVERIMYSMYCNGTLLLHGPTGTGKTSIAEQIAAHCVMPFYRFSCHGQMEVSDLLGSKSVINDNGTPITKTNHTDITLAAQYGGILCLDEVFRSPPEALMSLQSLFEYPHKLSILDAHDTKTVVDLPLADFKLVLTDNTTGNGSSSGAYAANAQDQSTQNRIRRAIEVPYLPGNTEAAMLRKKNPDVPQALFPPMVKVAKKIRDQFAKGEIQHTVSIRELLSWAESISHLRSVDEAFKYAFYNRLEQDDKPIVADIYEQQYGVSL
jgi:cobaltochelatase CobS